MLVVVEEVETWLVAQIVEVGHVSTAKELLFKGSSSDWLPSDKTDPQLIVPLEDPLQSSKEFDTFDEWVVEDNGCVPADDSPKDSEFATLESISANEPE